MKLKFASVALGLVVALLALGAVGSGGVASAQVPAGPGVRPAAAPDADDFDTRPWLRRSIVVCAADVMDLDVSQIVMGLRTGHSLKEIGIRAGVRPELLEAGILRCERAHLARLVNAGVLDPTEARRIFSFLQDHIDRIINYVWNPQDESLAS